MKIFGISLAVVAVLLVVFLFYQGVFSSVKLEEKITGDYWVVYQGHIGPYEKVGPVMDKVIKSLKRDGVEVTSACGIYYDDPSKVKKEKLRSEVGAVLKPEYYGKIGELRSKYNLKQLRKRKSLVVEFPLRNFLSYIIGPLKAYPAMDKYCKAKNIDIAAMENGYGLEIYDMKNRKITYIMPVE